MQEYKISKEKSFLFKLSIVIQSILMFLFFLDGKGYLPKNDKIGYAEIILSIIGFIALLLIYFFRKIGVYIYASVLIIGFMINPHTSDLIFTIFIFIGVGLSVIIPRWHLYK